METYKQIEDLNYSVSNLGNVKNDLRGNILKNNYSFKYTRVGLKGKIFMVHRLLAKAFIPNPENKTQVNHINGIKHDNRLENLEWVTPSENMIHAHKIGLKVGNKGITNGQNKLSEEQVLEIRFSYLSSRKIGIIYNINKSTVNDIRNNKIWKHIKNKIK